MEQNKEIDITDILCDRPLFFNIGHKQYEVYPASLGETLLRGQALKELGLNIKHSQLTTSEIMLQVTLHKDKAAKFIAVSTMHGKDASYNAREIDTRAESISKTLSFEELTTLIIMILSMDKTREAMHQLGIDKEQNKARRIQEIKNLSNSNSVTTGGASVYGSMISAACEKYGWTYDECVWGVSYSNLQLLLADSINSHILDEKERRMASVPLDGEEVINAGDPSNIEKLTKDYLKRKD